MMIRCLIAGATVFALAGTAAAAAAEGTSANDSGSALADSILTAKSPRSGADSLQVAAALDSIVGVTAAQGTETAFAAAETLVLRALALRTTVLGHDALPIAATLHFLGSLRFNRGDYEGAIAPHREALQIRTRLLPAGDRLVGESQHDLASALAAIGRYSEARPLLESAYATLSRSAPAGDLGLINLLTTLGEFRRIENRYADAESSLVRAIRLARASLPAGDPFIAYPINNLAGVYRDQGRFDEAEPLLRESLAIHAATSPVDPVALADASLNRAELLRLQGRNTEAESLYVKALQLAEQGLGSDDPTLVWFLNQYGVLHRDLGRWERAARLSRRSLAILERTGTDAPLLAQTLVDLAELLRLQNRTTEAERHARRAIALREQTYGADHPEVAMALVVLARCRSKRLDAGTDSVVARAVRILDAAPAYPEARIDAHAVRATRAIARGDTDAARRDLEIALAVVETLRPRRGGDDVRAGFVGGHARLYEDLVRLHVDAGDVEAAFAVVERGRGRVFLDQLTAARVDPSGDVDAATRAPIEQRLHDARLELSAVQSRMAALVARSDLAAAERERRLTALARERDRWTIELQRADDELHRASPRWRALVAAAGQSADAAAVAREVVPEGGIALVYALGEVGSWLFAAGAGSTPVRCFPLTVDAAAATALGLERPGPLRARDVAQAIAALELDSPPQLAARRGIGGVRRAEPRVDAQRDVAMRLHAWWRVLVPRAVRNEVLRAREAIVVPDGSLNALPFEALVVEPAAAGATSTNPPRDWLEAGPVVRYEPSLTALVHLQRDVAARAHTATGVVSIAAPIFSAGAGAFAGRKLEALPATARETAAVQAAFAPLTVVARTGAEATEARVRDALPGKHFVHIATHGVVDRNRDALLAGLALTPGASTASHDDDGFLQLFEIYRLDLDAELVVLSACETNAGALVAGEGVFALSRGFMAAGARRVVASLWQVEDESTATLVAGLFARLAQAERQGDDVDVAVALRDAKRELRRDARWARPFYWAPFVLAGVR